MLLFFLSVCCNEIRCQCLTIPANDLSDLIDSLLRHSAHLFANPVHFEIVT
jgi:hypothetical protein